ncbi:chromosome segregation protein SMC [Exiguobacterium sibiricum 255-15]|uniref:Chromosome partition protein Smc n=1 Tax=Exiguobacterium sibiricum (strain DSM 17290 / CCUG 55495 / CIP 109462 / JCM 13490 / 255-15) TaxID=262543 RepID=B1YIN0_EXIS2|nr:chromosome segregation protein SMC [Exiguobacterium sibiricum]ACB61356.1 chromosome segregation protein SMC [Exiguobacterium sibiricum 255-15]
MYLKRIEINGFKSFASRTELDFLPGVTAVVGPNGSGKSNISDAVRWVLGEQSAKSLRGAKMEDVIFAGSISEHRKQFAEVTLVLDNESGTVALPYQEINVTRRVTRNGDSDYFLNKKPCRLKDVLDLFMDTGLSRDAFAIIGQGRVEQVISGKPEERRSVIEEAAGVLKYRNRKKQAERKLTDTETNLSRVDDILYELGGRIEPLREQASLAKEFLVARERYDFLERGIIATEIEQYMTQLTDVSTEIESCQAQLLAEQERLQETIATRETQETSLEEKRRLETEMQDRLRLVSTKLVEIEGALNLAKEREKHGAEMKARLEQEVTVAEQRVAQIEQEEQTVLKQQQETQQLYLQTVAKREQADAALSYSDRDFEKEAEQLRSEAFEVASRLAATTNAYHRAQQDLLHAEEQQRSFSENVGSKQTDRSTYEAETIRLAEQVEELRNRLETLRQEEKTQQDQHRQQQDTLRQMEQSIIDLHRRRDKTEDRIEFLESVKADYSGYFGAVKTVLKQRDRIAGIHGAVAELITVPARFEAAIETALGGAMQNVVVDTDVTGRKLIQELRRLNAGRATFMPLSSIQRRELSASVQQSVSGMPGYLGVASQLVTTREDFTKLKDNLLGTTLVVESLEQANAIARSTGHRYRIVTLEGDVVNVGGSMTGGSRKKGTPLFSQSRELEELQAGLKQGQAVIREQERRRDEMKTAMQQLVGSLETNTRDIQLVQAQLESVREAYTDAKRSLAVTSSELSVHDGQLTRLAEQAAEAKSIIAASEQDMERLTNRQAELRQAIDQLKEAQSRGAVAVEELKQQQAEALLEERTVSMTHDQIDREVTRLRETLSHAKLERSHKRRDLKHVLEGFDEAKIDALHTEKTQMQQEQTSVERELTHVTAEIQQAAENLRLLRIQEAKLAEARQATTQRLDQARLTQGRLSTRLETRHETLEEMGLVAELIQPLTISFEEAKEELHLLKRQLEEIGIVNLGAIEEFAEVDQRFTFLSTQRDDLVSAKTDLYAVIEEMDREVIRLFKQTYTAVREHFRETFRELFGGGEADLILVDPTDLLTSGIDIVAKPPGKKLQNLSLLSGGERALTAIALLFAILKTRPVPFCVLDEVEAALDEANVARFGEFVHQLARETQFIIITHRKGTMESADVLYGVTMQQNGISEVLSVKLEEARRTLSEEVEPKGIKK